MRGLELARRIPDPPPLLDEASVRGELQDTSRRTWRRGSRGTIVSVGDEDVSVGRGDDVGGLVELARIVSRHPRLAQAQQYGAPRAELDHLMTLRPGVVREEVRDPDVPLAIHMEPVGRDERSGTEAGQHLSGLAIEFENRVHVVAVAVAATP